MKSETFFRKIEKNQRPIIVDVWAPWCAPCRRMEPLLDEFK
jgi:thiol-disulfide isomerase/thioredoxin